MVQVCNMLLNYLVAFPKLESPRLKQYTKKRKHTFCQTLIFDGKATKKHQCPRHTDKTEMV